MSMLTVADLTVPGAQRNRLSSVNLSLAGGQLVGVIGANGAGKSTLLKGIAGLLSNSRGEILLNGTPLCQLSAREQSRVIAYLPQADSPQWDITVTELVQIGLLQQRLSQHAQRVQVEAVMQQCDLTALAQRPVSTLSGGERQRALLARALVGEPQLLLCDEPTAALDIKHQLETMSLLKQRSEAGQLILCCLHDLPLAARFCDQLVLLQEGRLVEVGAPALVLSDTHLAQAFGVKAQWLCKDSGVAWIPQPLSDE